MFEKEFEMEYVAVREASELMKSSAFVTDTLTSGDCDGVSPYIFGKRYGRIERMLGY